MPRRTAALLALTLTAACRDSAGPDALRASVSTGAFGGAIADNGVLSATIPVVVTNDDVVSVYYDACATTLERQVSGEWQYAYGIFCALPAGAKGDPPGVEVAPGASRTFDFTVRSAFGAGEASAWKPPVDGTYRVRTMLRTRTAGVVRVTRGFALAGR